MPVHVPMEYTIDDILKDLKSSKESDGILLVKADDRFFVGGGCEYPSPVKTDASIAETGLGREITPVNISVCANGPLL